MQLKLLNFHKMLANFSTSLVGGFIPLIIYKHTLNFVWSIVYLIALILTWLIINLAFRKLYVKHPQIFLILRAIPMLGYSLAVLLIDVNFIWGVVLVTLLYATNLSFRGNSTEIILNYSTINQKDSKGLGVTRVFEQIGNIIALILGGLFLDYLPTYVLIAIAMAIYIISCVPLIMYYVRAHKEKGFNAEAVSNAYLALSENPDKSKKGKKLANNLILQYGFVYFLVALLDNFIDLFNLYIYIKYGQFAIAGYLSAVYNLTYAVSSYLVGFVSAKRDTTIISVICILINAVMVIIVPFISNIYVIYLIFGIIGFAYPFYSIFLLDRILSKARILGVSNRAIFMRENASQAGKLWGLIFGLFGSMIPMFIAMGIGLCACAFSLPENEETTRKALVNYLEGN